MNNSFTRPLAVVTGASNGIGYELAKQFARNGFDLLITSTGDSINKAAHALAELGTKVETVEADLATYNGVEKLYKQIQATGRPVDAIAINAGVGVGGDFARETDLKDELNLINLNVVSALHAGDAYFYRQEMDSEPDCTPGLRAYQWMMEVDRKARLFNQQRLRGLSCDRTKDVRVFCSHDAVEHKAFADQDSPKARVDC
ncbi:SDR family NAD(P)-dependent oxidoreductase [Floridanema aerugineum]|uniref:SDR family NAD(P)-dependent oxidoreductase n=1 Tax=Floridaenema aerugineum BLCC-F46 TaxID=3153654 RepID=A0ABV4XC60_9CYAN